MRHFWRIFFLYNIMNLFFEEIQKTAISRIEKFAKIADAMGYDVTLGFSGGKDSQVCYDLCKRSGIQFKAYFNHCFESSATINFIKQHYPDVVFRRVVKDGFIRNIQMNHNGFLPTVQSAYCCQDYKHNPHFVDACSITGVRKSESAKRKQRTTFEAKNRTILKKNKQLIDTYFEDRCQSVGSSNIITLKPIIDWSDADVWDYIHYYNLPVNPEYKYQSRVGCVVCPKSNFTRNYQFLLNHPKIIDAFIKAREKSTLNIDWIITSDNKDYENDKCYYICRWLNHSFMPFTKKQELLYQQVKQVYNKHHEQTNKI